MAKPKKPKKTDASAPQLPTLPKDVLQRLNLGQSFAEYDPILQKQGVYVVTPALRAASDRSRGRCFFIGRRGTGKTAITFYLKAHNRHVLALQPEIFTAIGGMIDVDAYRDTRNKPFRSLASAFARALICEAFVFWVEHASLNPSRVDRSVRDEIERCRKEDFDQRVLRFHKDYASKVPDFEAWSREMDKVDELIENARAVAENDGRIELTILIDRIDEDWDGSDASVVVLMALMHACLLTASRLSPLQPKVFLRENIFERVREIDNEFARLETSVVSLDWTPELLLDMIERRLNVPFVTKLPMGGVTWDYFFESAAGTSSRDLVFGYCQERPRDVLTYCSFAIEAAQSRNHPRVSIEDLQSARRRFSDSRLKDLGDEYAENYPRIDLVLGRFFGLGTEYTIAGIAAFLQKLLVDAEVKKHCATWLFKHTTPEAFIHLLYNIGFIGIADSERIHYRSVGAKSSTPPPINSSGKFVVHPTYVDALNLRSAVIGSLDRALQYGGVLSDLPEGTIDLDSYEREVKKLQEDLKSLQVGDETATAYENLVGELIRLCFFRQLSNIQPQVRDLNGAVRRDWIASNRATSGFWQLMAMKHGATQVIWECKNYKDLSASDFHQIAYYLNDQIGRFGLICFRGEVQNHHYEHLRRMAANDRKYVLLLSDKDLQVFLRQAISGKDKEGHLQDNYDRTGRKIS